MAHDGVPLKKMNLNIDGVTTRQCRNHLMRLRTHNKCQTVNTYSRARITKKSKIAAEIRAFLDDAEKERRNAGEQDAAYKPIGKIARREWRGENPEATRYEVDVARQHVEASTASRTPHPCLLWNDGLPDVVLQYGKATNLTLPTSEGEPTHGRIPYGAEIDMQMYTARIPEEWPLIIPKRHPKDKASSFENV